jgi:hypothetical protein
VIRPSSAAGRLVPYAAIAAGLAAVYEPVLRSTALFNDDYTNFVEAPPFAWILGAAGRPVQYLLALAGHRLVSAGPGNVPVLRAVLFGLALALAAVIFRTARRGLGAPGAVALVLFVFSVPSYLITVGWPSVAINLPAYLAAAGSYATGYLLLGKARGAAARAALGAATAALVALASLTYQVAAGLPLALVVYHLLFEGRDRAAARRALVASALVCAGLVLSLVALRVILRMAEIPLADRAQGVLARLASPRGLLVPLRVFDANFALHYYYWGWFTREGAILVGLALTAVIARVAWREVRAAAPDREDGRWRWAAVGAALAVTGMLFALDASRELRSKPFLTLLLLFVAVYAVRETAAWARLRGPAATAAVVAVVVVTMWSGRDALSRGLVAYTEAELAEVRAALAATAPGSLRRVHVVRPESRCFSPPCYGSFEFRLKLASSQEWVPRGMVRYALAQLGRAAEGVETTSSPAPPDDPAALVVDLRALERRLSAEHGEVLDLDRFLQRRRTLGPDDSVSLAGLWLRVTPASARRAVAEPAQR